MSKVERQDRIIFPMHYSKDKRLMQIVVSLKDEPGALASALQLLGSRVNLIGVTSYSTEKGTAIASAFAEVLSKKETVASLKKDILRQGKVLGCEVYESKDGLLVDWFHTGIRSGLGEPHITLPTEGLAKTFEAMVRVFGSGGETILYHQGREFAKSRFEAYKKMLGPNPGARVSELKHFFEANGYGASTITMGENGKSATVVTKECFECSVPSHVRRECAFRRGLAVGAFEPIMGGELEGEEVKCRFRGDDVCEFTLSRKN